MKSTPQVVAPAPTQIRASREFVPAESTKVNLSAHQTTLRFGNVLEFKLGHREIQSRPLRVKTGQYPRLHKNIYN
jgi:hypothetical protein